MKTQPGLESNPYRYLLVPYDPENPDPCITPKAIQYIKSRQPGLTDRDIVKLDEIEWFTFHRQLKTLNQFSIPGLRPLKDAEVRYVKRFNTQKYWEMMNHLFSYIPPYFPRKLSHKCLAPAYRLTCPNGDHFYPIEYRGDLPLWRRRISDNAAHFGTTVGYFDHGRFVISDGQEIEFADMDVASYAEEGIPSNF